LGSLALANVPEAPPDAAEQAWHLKRNRHLMQALVKGSLELASEEDAVQRVRCYGYVLKKLAKEIGQAADQREGPRAVELGQHFQVLLQQGVAANLTTVAEQIPRSSEYHRQLVLAGRDVVSVTEPLETQLKRALDSDAHEDIQRALKAISDGRSSLEGVLQSRQQINDRDPK